METDGRRIKGRSGDYRLLAQLVASDLSSIHLAVRLGIQGLDRFVVFRQLHAHLASETEPVEQFLNQARIAAKFRQPNLVRVVEAGKSKAGIFSVAEYLAGDGLGYVLACGLRAGRAFPPALAAGVVAQACDGLDFAHSLANKQGQNLGVLHKNLNPRNLVVGPLGVVKLINLDVARPADRPHPSRLSAYLSPEQCLGTPVGPASDLFSLGVVLWEALALRRLFARSDEMETRRAVMALKIPDLRALRPEVDPGLNAVALRALSRRPEQRFGSAAEMATALRAALAKAGQPAGPDEVATYLQQVLGERIQAKLEMLEQIESRQEAPADTAWLLPDSTVELPPVDGDPGRDFGAEAVTRPFSLPAALPPRPGPSVDDLPVPPPPVPEDLDLDDLGAQESAFAGPDDPFANQPPTLATGRTVPERPARDLPVPPAAARVAGPDLSAGPDEPPGPIAPAAGECEPPPTLEDLLEVAPTFEEVLDAAQEPAAVRPPALPRVALAAAMSTPLSEEPDPPMEAALRIRRSYEQYLVPGLIAGGVLLLLIVLLVAWLRGMDGEAGDEPDQVDPSEQAEPIASEPGAEGPAAPAGAQTDRAAVELAVLRIHSDPAGCEVFLGDLALNGRTPLDNVVVPAGRDLEVAVACRGYERESRHVTAAAGSKAALEFYPLPLAKSGRQWGRLQLTTGRPVEVFLGKQRLGFTPLLGVRLLAGTHQLRLVHRGAGIAESLTVTIQPGETTILEQPL